MATMDSAKPPTASQAKSRGNGRKRASRTTAQKPPPRNATTSNGRRGRFKRYNDARVQAAFERQRDLKDSYSNVASALKPILDMIATRTVDKLKEDALHHRRMSDYSIVQGSLDDRLKSRLEQEDRTLAERHSALEKKRQMAEETTRKAFTVRCCLLFRPFSPSCCVGFAIPRNRSHSR